MPVGTLDISPSPDGANDQKKSAGQISAFTGYDELYIRGAGGDGGAFPTPGNRGGRGVIKIYELF
jgi:hypothetical protein